MGFRSTTASSLKQHGIDARQLKTLLAVYLKQDLRGGKSFQQFNSSEYIRSNFALLAIVSIYLLLGLMMGTIVFAVNIDALHYSMFTLTYTLFIIALAMLAESGSVIFNEAETDVLGHLPISPRTHFAAKVANLFLFTLLLATAANFFPAIMGIWAAGSSALFPLAHALSASLVALMATAIVMVSYGLLMRYVSRERFDSIITYSQVLLVLFFMFGFQILPRIIESDRLFRATGFKWYYLLFPPAWFSGIAMIVMGKIEPGILLLAATGLLVLVVLGQVALRKIAGGYTAQLSELVSREARSGRQTESQAAVETTGLATGRLHSIKSIILRSPAERAVFDLVTVYLRRNREIKVRLYPSLAYLIFFPLLAVFTEGLPDPFASSSGGYSLMAAAMICFVSLTAVEGLVFSEHYGSAYIFRVAPVSKIGEVHGGIRKAVLLWLALPGFVALTVLYSVMWRNPLHAFLVVAPWMIMSPAVLMSAFLFREVLPLARKYQKGQQTARNVWVFVVSIITLSFIGAFQVMAIKGGYWQMTINLPYWLFIIIIGAISATLYVIFERVSERRPIMAGRDG